MILSVDSRHVVIVVVVVVVIYHLHRGCSVVMLLSSQCYGTPSSSLDPTDRLGAVENVLVVVGLL